MKDNRKTIQVLIILTIIFSVMGGSLAYWNWNTTEAQKTNVVFTVTKNFSCAADGGGNITSSDVTLAPTTCTDTTRAIQRTVTVTPTLNKNDLTIHMNLWLDINTLDSGLSESLNFKYALTTSSTSCTEGVIYSGNFNGKNAGDQVKLLGKSYSSSTPQTYYLYIWLDEAETSPSTMNQNFSLSLGGDCNDMETDLSYNVTTVDNISTFGVGTGLYALSDYTCKNNTTLSYDSYTRLLTSNGVDKCDLEFTSINSKLYDVVEIGDYISYTGDSTNGCKTTNQSSDETCTNCNQCNGWNANQTNTDIYDNYGYCYSDSSKKFYTYGWRVLYKKDNSVYIVSAGAPECVTGVSSNPAANKSNLNQTSLKYCNNSYLSGGMCDNTTAHAFNGDDFYQFTSQYYGSSNARYLYNYEDTEATESTYCFQKKSNTYCGYHNDIIDNGGWYFFASASGSPSTLDWDPRYRMVYQISGTTSNGVRPVLKLDSSVMITGGVGSMTNPYTISTRSGA